MVVVEKGKYRHLKPHPRVARIISVTRSKLNRAQYPGLTGTRARKVMVAV
jgi:hypothetical protein